MTDLLAEDADLRSNLAALGPAALREIQDVLGWPQPRRDEFLRSLVGRRDLEPLTQLIAIADTGQRGAVATAASDPGRAGRAAG